MKSFSLRSLTASVCSVDLLYSFVSSALARMVGQYSVVERGAPFTESYRLFLKKDNEIVSPWHDVPLFANESGKVYNMICEIPRWTNAKMEIGTKEPVNPIRQDVKNGKVRFVHNCFPYNGYIWNYGALPQTWEDPNHVDPNTGARGDNDPIDVCEIGQRVAKRGELIQVKLLGLIALIDEGETDWKIIAIDIQDPLAKELNDIDDVNRLCPGYLNATREWLKIYKIPAGKPPNKFGLNGEFQNRAFAEHVVKETHEFWKNLVKSNATGGLWCGQRGAAELSSDSATAQSVVNSTASPSPPACVDDSVNKWHFVNRNA